MLPFNAIYFLTLIALNQEKGPTRFFLSIINGGMSGES